MLLMLKVATFSGSLSVPVLSGVSPKGINESLFGLGGWPRLLIAPLAYHIGSNPPFCFLRNARGPL